MLPVHTAVKKANTRHGLAIPGVRFFVADQALLTGVQLILNSTHVRKRGWVLQTLAGDRA